MTRLFSFLTFSFPDFVFGDSSITPWVALGTTVSTMTARSFVELRSILAAGSFCPPAVDARVRKYVGQPRVLADRGIPANSGSAGIESGMRVR